MTKTDSPVVQLLKDKGLRHRSEAFQLTSGELSNDYIDGKATVSEGKDLELVAKTIVELLNTKGISFDAVGGLTMGADAISHAVALVSSKKWFSIRKTVKAHGTENRVEGAKLTPGVSVLLVEDIVTTGGSILSALDAVEQAGARTVAAVTLVNRGKVGSARLSERGVELLALCTYKDLGIAPVGGA